MKEDPKHILTLTFIGILFLAFASKDLFPIAMFVIKGLFYIIGIGLILLAGLITVTHFKRKKN